MNGAGLDMIAHWNYVKSNWKYARAVLSKGDLQLKNCSGCEHERHAWASHNID